MANPCQKPRYFFLENEMKKFRQDRPQKRKHTTNI